MPCYVALQLAAPMFAVADALRDGCARARACAPPFADSARQTTLPHGSLVFGHDFAIS